MADTNRRDFLKACVGGAVCGGIMVPSAASAFSLDLGGAFNRMFGNNQSTQVLSLHNLHTGERVRDVCFFEQGRFNRDALREINYLLRDHRSGDVTRMDPELLRLLARVRDQMQSTAEVQVISGYRSPKTNEMLRARGKGVSKNSYHTKGQAIDIRIPDRDLNEVKQVALHMQRGGVGHYSRSGFLHLDTGRVRSWTS